MTHDFSKAFASAGNRAVISEKEWSEGWFAIVGGINGIPTAQQFNTVSYLIESKVNEAYRVASQALTGLDSKVNITVGYGLMADKEREKLQGIYAGSTKTEGSATNGNIKINGVEKQVYRHPTGPGNEHIPTGGTAGQVLQKTADGYGWGTGGMMESVYDPTGRRQDIFAFATALAAADIDCGTFDALTPVAAHNESPGAHAVMMVDGNATAEVGGGGELAAHETDPLAHQNIILDGNLN